MINKKTNKSYNIMTKNDFKKLVPDVMCQDLVVTTDNPATPVRKG